METTSRTKTLLSFLGHYILVVMRPERQDANDEEEEAEPKAYVGILAATDTTVITIAAAAKVHYRSRTVLSHLGPNYVSDAFPVMISLRLSSLQRIAKCREASLGPLFNDAKRLAHGHDQPPSDATCMFFVRVLVRRYAGSVLIDRVLISEGQDPVQQLEEAIAEAVGGAPPNTNEVVSRIRMPVAEFVSQAVRELTVIQPPASTASPATAGTQIADRSAIGAMILRVPQLLSQTRITTVREWLREDSIAFRTHFKPRRKSPTTLVLAITDRYVRTCFLVTILVAISYCILGGIMVGASIAGPITSSATLETNYVDYMWYMLIPPGVVLAIFGIFQSARAEAASMPASSLAKFWIGLELFIGVCMFPGFVFGAWFLNGRDTARAQYSTPRSYWVNAANTSRGDLCSYQIDHSCSGWDSICYLAYTSTQYQIYVKDDCPQRCVLPLKYLTNLPTTTCASSLLSTVDGVSKELVGFFVAYLILALLRNGLLAAVRAYFASRVRGVFQAAAAEDAAAAQAQEAAAAA